MVMISFYILMIKNKNIGKKLTNFEHPSCQVLLRLNTKQTPVDSLDLLGFVNF